MDSVSCTNCDTNCLTTAKSGQWWYLGNYFGISGHFCPKCYDKVSHDAYGRPENPIEYEKILNKQRIMKPGSHEPG